MSEVVESENINKTYDKFDKLYKDLIYTKDTYFAGEQIFPAWENIYALIVSGLFGVYFIGPSKLSSVGSLSIGGIEKIILSLPFERILISIIGILFSYSWWRIVEKNFIYSKARSDKLRILEAALKNLVGEVEVETGDKKEKIFLFNLNERQDDYKEKAKKKLKDTWIVRTSLPKWLTFIWLLLLSWNIFLTIKFESPFIIRFLLNLIG